MNQKEGSILLFFLIVAFFVGYWLVGYIYTKLKMPKLSNQQDEPQSHGNRQQKQQDEDSMPHRERVTGQYRDLLTHYCDLLELGDDNSPENIKAKYFEMIKKYHPDKVNHLGYEFQKMAEQKTVEINRAYEYLKKIYRFS